MLDVDEDELPSAINNHRNIMEIATHLLSRSNPASSLISSSTTDDYLEFPSTNMERGLEETACLGKSDLAILGPESFQIQSMDLSFEGSGQFGLVAHRTRPKENLIATETPMSMEIILKAYDFSPDCTALQQHIDFSKLETLELMNCANLGFLFNSMLCTYEIYYLKVLRIRGGTLQSQHAGYFGKEKLERFLMLHTGLQELTFANLGVNRPSLQAVSAQGATLQALIMHESKCLNPSNAMQRSTISADALRHLSERCPRVQNLSVDLSTNNLSCSSEIAGDLRRYQSITRLEISLPSWEQSLSLDRAWAIKTFTNVASPRLKRLDIYSSKSHSHSTGLQDTYKQNSGCHWRIDRVGKDLLAADITPLIDGSKSTIVREARIVLDEKVK